MKKKSKILLGGLIGSLVIIFFLSPMLMPNIAAQNLAAPNSSPSAKETNAIKVSDEPPSIEQGGLTLTEIFERTEKGVVSISVQKPPSLSTEGGLGSGFVYDKNGNIITNNHVVDGANKILVTFIDGTTYNAKIIGTDPLSDLAVVRVDVVPSKLNPLSLGDSSIIKVGQRVAAIGNPFGLSGSMTAGIVSQLGRLLPSQGTGFTIPDVIQTDAAINPGNSGGPLLNMQGEIIGINTAIYSNGGDFSGIGFSIPADTISKIIPQLIQNGEYKHPWIGVTSVNVNPDLAEVLHLKEAKGVQILTVVKDSPADKAGVKGSSQTVQSNGTEYVVGGDIVLAIDDRDVRKIDDILVHLQREKNVGDNIDLKILRDGKIMNLKITLEERPRL